MGESTDRKKARISIVTPAFNEAANLPQVYERLREVLDACGLDWEWIVVDDHSADGTFETLTLLNAGDARVRSVRLASNSGSHMAISCGLELARGDCALVMSADQQDPPELIPRLLLAWENGAQTVWAARREREGEKKKDLLFSRLYYVLMRRVVNISDMPATGADFFLLDKMVIDAFLRFKERNLNVMALFSWMGFKQEVLFYDKKARVHGKSGWTLRKKIKLAVDSVLSFSYLPIRLMSLAGIITSAVGFLYAFVVLLNVYLGKPVQGWTSLMIVVLIIGGMQILMLGVLGEYLWRTLDEARRRPRYLIEAVTRNAPERDDGPRPPFDSNTP